MRRALRPRPRSRRRNGRRQSDERYVHQADPAGRRRVAGVLRRRAAARADADALPRRAAPGGCRRVRAAPTAGRPTRSGRRRAGAARCTASASCTRSSRASPTTARTTTPSSSWTRGRASSANIVGVPDGELRCDMPVQAVYDDVVGRHDADPLHEERHVSPKFVRGGERPKPQPGTVSEAAPVRAARHPLLRRALPARRRRARRARRGCRST